MKKRRGALSAILALALLCLAASGAFAANYQFDDVHGASSLVRGAQWVSVASDDTAVGGPHTERLITNADIVADRDHLYIHKAGEYYDVGTLLFVIPEGRGTMFFKMASAQSTIQEVEFAFDGKYNTTVTTTKDTVHDKEWTFEFEKTDMGEKYETVIGTMIIHHNTPNIPSQTLEIPFVIASVYNGSAVGKPLNFRAVVRETYSGSASGDVVAASNFTWTVADDLRVTKDADNWIYVPVDSVSPLTADPYILDTRVVNYSGLRYTLQRYDTSAKNPAYWTFDSPKPDEGAVNNFIIFDPLSHMPPGLVTNYEREFDVLSETNTMFEVYPVKDETNVNVFRDLTIDYPTVKGLPRGDASGTSYYFSSFQLVPNNSALVRVIEDQTGAENIRMPSADITAIDDNSVYPIVFASTNINAIELNSQLDPGLVTSDDYRVSALLPLHITFNLPYEDSLIKPKWNDYLDEWKRSGSIRESVASAITFYIENVNGDIFDIFKYLKGQGVFDKTVKILLDEEKECITVNLIVMVLNNESTDLQVITDSASGTESKYLLMRDGANDDHWYAKFITGPHGYDTADGTNNRGGGGGGGGCHAGFAATTIFIALLGTLFARSKNG